MLIRNSTFAIPRRASFVQNTAPQQFLRPTQLDTFVPAAQVQPTAIQQSAQAGLTSSSSSGGGFFSQLFGKVKDAFSGLLGKASSWLSTNVGPMIDKAKSWVSDLVGGLLGKASSWLGGLLSKWQGNVPN